MFSIVDRDGATYYNWYTTVYRLYVNNLYEWPQTTHLNIVNFGVSFWVYTENKTENENATWFSAVNENDQNQHKLAFSAL